MEHTLDNHSITKRSPFCQHVFVPTGFQTDGCEAACELFKQTSWNHMRVVAQAEGIRTKLDWKTGIIIGNQSLYNTITRE